MKIPIALSILGLAFTSVVSAQEAKVEKAVFGAGCFWCVEAFFEQQPGVTDVVSGYAGGDEKNPTYEQVGSGRSGHVEVVQVTYDPSKTSYEKLVSFFWLTHDVTDGRGVAPDFGRQYRSIILTDGAGQEAAAQKSKAEAQKGHKKPIATEIAPLKQFWPAETYNQDYVRKNPKDGYVKAVAIPKLKKLGLKLPE